ncbi:uncharacterized protein L969DRAFT_93790 [Mixia osmundae IAM 14324]|uniref:J domain-containing protein n=1 Tax=Mixia osmundae (strain CBS 9802 / IAM 14324 / JCM 22182 / KY 12970) TaxID=764103 RepID=G7E9K9_MIXOS|nr:uncharacterized protein L969DRAFT_93790 [Mixia osmundae IAM 14324]KEI39959.1 hypothetical protein L969DRAFT_93790 [Mixia osmundae IAM 14324]GAA99328.1 hypothetical protein E5Q_06023 [Mixia osmundae IAM 14324]
MLAHQALGRLARRASLQVAAGAPHRAAQVNPTAPFALSLDLSHRLSRRPSSRSKRSYAVEAKQHSRIECPVCHATRPIKAGEIVALCPDCKAVQPLQLSQSTSHFDIFELPRHFSIDQTALKRAFLKWQQLVHPDRAGSNDKQKSWAFQWSTLINEAYQTLLSDRRRAEYMLSLEGVTVEEADKITDPDLLMSILESRETLEEAETEEDVHVLREDNKGKIRTTVQELEAVLDAHDKDLQLARTLTIKLRYYENVDQACKDWAPGRPIEIQH